MITTDFLFDLDLWIESFSFLVALLISAFSLRTYILTKQRKHFFFAAAFAMIAGGVALSALLNYFVEFEELSIALRGFVPVSMNQGYVLALSMLGILAGFMTLFIINSELRDKRAIIMLYMLTVFTAVIAHEVFIVYHVTSFIVVGCIFSHYLVNYEKQHTRSALLVLLAFTALLLAEAVLTFTIFHAWFYVTGNLVRLTGFLLFFAAIISIYTKR